MFDDFGGSGIGRQDDEVGGIGEDAFAREDAAVADFWFFIHHVFGQEAAAVDGDEFVGVAEKGDDFGDVAARRDDALVGVGKRGGEDKGEDEEVFFHGDGVFVT